MNPFALVCLLVLIGLPVFFYYAATRQRFTIAFFVALMTSAAAISLDGIAVFVNSQSENIIAWQGIAMLCFGLTLLLATMVACVLLRGR